MRRVIRVPPHCELHEPSRHPWRRHLRARHLSGGGRCLLPAADLPRPRGPRGARRRAQPGGGGGPRALRRPAPADRPSRGQPRDRRGLQHDRRARRAASSSPCSATTTAASPIASPARSPSSTAIPTPASSTAPPRSSTARGSRAARGPAATARRTSSCATWCASTTRWSTPRAWSTAASTRPSAATTRPSALAQDFDFWLRAVRAFRFRDVPGAPLIGFRRHGENFSDESARDLEVQEVERALRTLIDAAPLRELVPELDWGVMHPQAAERRALEVLADAFDARAVAASRAGARAARPRRARARAAAPRRPTGARSSSPPSASTTPAAARPCRALAAKELARRGWDVTVFHAAARPDPSGAALRRARVGWRTASGWSASTTASTGCWDLGNPLRELDDPPITAGLRAAAGPRARPTSCTSTTCTTSARR